MIRILAILLLLLLAACLQISFISPFGFGTVLMLPLVSIVYLALSWVDRRAIWLALLTGFVLDLFSPLPFGLSMLSLSAVALLTELLFLNFFTNRSIYAMLVLLLAGTLLHALIWFGGAKLLAAMQFSTYSPSWRLVNPWALLGNTLAGIALFYTFVGLNSVFGRYFMARRRSRSI